MVVYNCCVPLIEFRTKLFNCFIVWVWVVYMVIQHNWFINKLFIQWTRQRFPKSEPRQSPIQSYTSELNSSFRARIQRKSWIRKTLSLQTNFNFPVLTQKRATANATNANMKMCSIFWNKWLAIRLTIVHVIIINLNLLFLFMQIAMLLATLCTLIASRIYGQWDLPWVILLMSFMGWD